MKALVFVRFEPGSKMTRELLTKIVKTKKELDNLPVITDDDFGHIYPMLILPIGGRATFKASGNEVELKILQH